MEYRVEHPRWRTWAVDAGEARGDLAALYGSAFGAVLAHSPPDSMFLAEGSEIAVHHPARL